MKIDIGLSKRSYQQRKQLMKTNEKLMDFLISTGKNNPMNGLLKLSTETEEM